MAAATDAGDTAYGRRFYAGQATGSRTSAAAVLAEVAPLLQPKSVLDVGCGVGTWLAQWQDMGVADVLGLDGAYVDPADLQIARERFRATDLAQGFHLGRRFDLVESLEVAEHLEESHADLFVADLARHGDAILFSAAIPGQGGTRHVNEQWLSYWVPKFRGHGFELFDVLRPKLWNDDRIEFWYRQNAVLFAKGEPAKRLTAHGLAAMPVLDVVHPLLLDKTPPALWYRAARWTANHLLPPLIQRFLKRRFLRPPTGSPAVPPSAASPGVG